MHMPHAKALGVGETCKASQAAQHVHSATANGVIGAGADEEVPIGARGRGPAGGGPHPVGEHGVYPSSKKESVPACMLASSAACEAPSAELLLVVYALHTCKVVSFLFCCVQVGRHGHCRQ